jgi:peptide/nickel transport system permease protein
LAARPVRTREAKLVKRRPFVDDAPVASASSLGANGRVRARRYANSFVLVALSLLTGILLLACLAPWIAPADPLAQSLGDALGKPRMAIGAVRGVLGTDQLGRDLLSRIIFGARISLFVVTITVMASVLVGVALGVVAGYFRGPADAVIMSIGDVQLAFPAILLAIAIVSALGPGLANTILVLVVTSWVGYARVVRSEVLSLRERESTLAARALGAADARIIVQHICPQLMSAITVLATLDLGRIVIMEAALSFLGLGVPQPAPSWGNLLADGREFIWTSWWLALFPGMAITLLVWSTNITGDWLRDRFDPRLSA